MEILGVILGFIGLQPVLALLYERVIRGFGVRRLIDFDSSQKCRVDIVCTTGASAPSRWGTSAAHRTLAPEGEVRGLAAVGTALGKWYPRKDFRVEMSARLASQCDHDLVVLGGPDANECARNVLTWPSLASLVSIDASNSTVRIGGFSEVNYRHEFVDGRPTRDLCVVICSRNAWSANSKKRLFCFAGLTTYGTGAAPQLFLDRIGEKGFDRRQKKAIRKSVVTLMVFSAHFNNGYLQGGRLIHFESH
ncbi:hypothetical protein AB0H49_10540 [Nocardia sp. NPDC050713]|uniref:hypothetical protein n=1 Tax=Nocardia sp. NPDC050713 TaxID=3154511 RepID=UPI00340D3F4E